MTSAQRQAVEVFLHGGCVRAPNRDRKGEGHRVYKKGWEVRFSIGSKAEAAETRRLLERTGLSPGRSYQKTPNSWILPLYGREQVRRFLGWVDEVE